MRETRTHIDPNTIGRGVHLAGGASLLLAAFGRHSMLTRLLMLAGAGTLIYQGIQGRGPLYHLLEGGAMRRRARPVKIEHTVTVNRPVEEVYSFWRNLENLPRFMTHLHSVETLDEHRSYWRAQSPFGGTVEWEAEITKEAPNEELGWRSLPGSQVDSAGAVRFLPALNGRGTLIQVEMKYTPPAGRIGSFVARLLGEDPQTQIEDDLEKLRHLLESGGAIAAGEGLTATVQAARGAPH